MNRFISEEFEPGNPSAHDCIVTTFSCRAVLQWHYVVLRLLCDYVLLTECWCANYLPGRRISDLWPVSRLSSQRKIEIFMMFGWKF